MCVGSKRCVWVRGDVHRVGVMRRVVSAGGVRGVVHKGRSRKKAQRGPFLLLPPPLLSTTVGVGWDAGWCSNPQSRRLCGVWRMGWARGDALPCPRSLHASHTLGRNSRGVPPPGDVHAPYAYAHREREGGHPPPLGPDPSRFRSPSPSRVPPFTSAPPGLCPRVHPPPGRVPPSCAQETRGYKKVTRGSRVIQQERAARQRARVRSPSSAGLPICEGGHVQGCALRKWGQPPTPFAREWETKFSPVCAPLTYTSGT